MPETIGQRLKKEREARFITLEKAFADTHIRAVFLQALEADDYSVLPSAAQGRGFLRNYAAYLDLNVDEMIAEMQKNAPPPEEISGPLPQVNLAETEIPAAPSAADEKIAQPFWTIWLRSISDFFGKSNFSPLRHEDAEKEETIGDADGIKPAEESLPDAANLLDVKEEAGESRFARLTAWMRRSKPTGESIPESIPEEIAPAVAEPAAPTLPADAIFAEIGAKLRERRELISLTVEEVELHTKLRVASVKALEAGAFDKLPSPVQTRGMLANYAAFLDIDPDTILLRFADGLQARRHEKYAETPREKIQFETIQSLPLLRSFIAGDLIFGVTIIALLTALVIWGVGRAVNSQNEKPEPTAPSIVDVLSGALPTASVQATIAALDTPTPTPTLDPLVTVEASPTLSGNANVTVSVFAVERVFARISVDGETAFEGRLSPRDTKTFEANDQVMILTGNAAALRVTYNGRDLGLMGATGEVISRVYLITGIATPTATVSPTPTNTPLTTDTPTPTMTPTFTPISP